MNNTLIKKKLLNIPFYSFYINDNLVGEDVRVEWGPEIPKRNVAKNIMYFELTNLDQGIINEYINKNNIVTITVKYYSEVVLEKNGIILDLDNNIVVFEEHSIELDSLINKI